MTNKKKKSNFPLRLPPELEEKIDAWMLRHPGVSKNSAICLALANWLENKKERQIKRQALTDSNKWFNIEMARKFEEARYHDGQNFISQATGSQWSHEDLYYTKGGKWIKNSWSQYQGAKETWEEISKEEASSWLVKNDHDDVEILMDEIAALEI